MSDRDSWAQLVRDVRELSRSMGHITWLMMVLAVLEVANLVVELIRHA
jgi:hypothetical protein